MFQAEDLVVRHRDFSHGGFHAEPHDFQFFWLEFLRFSPSYELARRFRKHNEKLNDKDMARLPADFERVLEVFDDFGDVQRTLFKPWLLERGVRLFGKSGQKPRTKLLCKCDAAEQLDMDQLTKNIHHYLENDWLEQSKPEFMLITIPLTQPKTHMLKEVGRLYDSHAREKNLEVGKYKLANKGMHRQNVIDALAVLYIRAAAPSYKLWQVGVEAKVSPTYSQMFSAKTSKRTAQNADEFRVLEMMTARKLRLAKHLAENAARGSFPDTTKPAHMVEFDPREFRRIISRHIEWKKSVIKAAAQ